MSRPIDPVRAMEPQCYTVNEFCAAHRIGLNSYYRLKKQRLGPHEMHVGTKTLITKESAARWRAARDAEEEDIQP